MAKTAKQLHWSVLSWAFAILQLGLGAGCQSFQSSRPFPVLLRDADTKTPVSGAQVSVSYPVSRSPLAPSESSAATSDDGIARLWVAPFGDGFAMRAAAQGYLAEDKDVAVTTIEKIAPVRLFESAEQRPPTMIIDLYREPAFSVELTIPLSYRGIIKADIDLRDGVPCPPGQRCFTYAVSPSGEVSVVGPSLLRRVPPHNYHARYADGTPLDTEMGLAKVGFRWLKQEGKQHYYVVGTQPEYEAFARELVKEESSHHRSGDPGEGNRRGGRHHPEAAVNQATFGG
jgi:hypothetical protein